MKRSLYIAIALFTLFACEKDMRDDLEGDATISGQLSYTDKLNGSGEVRRMAGTKVFIADAASDSVNYIYYTVTDAQGNFTFKRLKQQKEYLIFTTDSVDRVYFSAYIKKTAPSDSIKLIARNDSVRQNALLFYLTNTLGEPVKDVSVGLYNNQELFQTDTAMKLTLGKKTTDQYGRVVFYNFRQANYYIRAKYQTDAGLISADSSYNFSGKGIRTYSLTLKTQAATQNTLLIRAVDEQGNNLPGITCCVFNNPLLFNAESCSGSYADRTTGNDGTVKLANLQAGSYYIFAHTSVNNNSFTAKATVNVNAAGQTSLTVVLRKVAPRNELEIITNDEASTPLNGVSLYFFTSKKLWEADTTLGNIMQKSTGNNGKLSVTNMDEGKYYIRARLQLGDDILMKGADSVTVVNSPEKLTKVIVVK